MTSRRRTTRRAWVVWSIAATLALAPTGLLSCRRASPGRAVPAELDKPRRSLRIAMIAKSSTNPVFLAARTGAEAEARVLGQRHGVDIDIVWLTPPQEDAQIQAQRIAQAVNEGVDAVMVSCSDGVKLTAAIDAAVGHGVPVMTFDSDAPDSKRFAYYGVDDLETGQRVMDALAASLQGRGRVAILAGNKSAPNLRLRAEGVRLAAQKYPEVRIVDTFFHVETPQDAAATVVRASKEHPEINGWAMVGGWALATKTLLSDLDPHKVSLVAVDALPPMLVYVEKGLAPVLLAQPTYEWGSVGVRTVVSKVLLHESPPSVIPMKLIPVSRATLGAWARQLKAWGFADVPDEALNVAK